MPDSENERRPDPHGRFVGVAPSPPSTVPVTFDPTSPPDDRPAGLVLGDLGWGVTWSPSGDFDE